MSEHRSGFSAPYPDARNSAKLSLSSLYGALFPATLDGNDAPKPRKTRLPQLKLHTDRQRKALAAMKVSGCNQRQFERLVLAHLALVRDVGTQPEPKKKGARIPLIASPSGHRWVSPIIVRELRRTSSLASAMAERLERQSGILRDFGVLWQAEAPLRELQLYAEKLTILADQFAVKVHRPRHGEHAQTRHTVELISFVQGMTSKRHWDNLAILLGEACNDQGINGDRLRKTVGYHTKKRRSQHATLPIAARKHLFLSKDQSAQKPPSA